MNQFSAIEINKKQRDVYNAYLRVVEVATRECGWTTSDAKEADEAYKQACNAYTSAYDCAPELEATRDMLNFHFPLRDATAERIKQISLKE
jgi:hypothetical protein